MHTLRGGCHCGRLKLEIELSQAPAEYAPRACDCSYCRKHGATYVADAAGALRLHIADAQSLGRYRQGAGLAEFLYCTACGVLVAVRCEQEGGVYAAANAGALDDLAQFKAAVAVSPQRLAPAEKLTRWAALWFRKPQFVFAETSAGD